MAALRLLRQRIVDLKVVQININQSKERLRAILATRYSPTMYLNEHEKKTY